MVGKCFVNEGAGRREIVLRGLLSERKVVLRLKWIEQSFVSLM